MRILFVAKNIPLPGRPGNPVVLTIANCLQERGHQPGLVFPKEWVPWFLRHHPKYRHLYGLSSWHSQGLLITPWTYPRLPHPAHAYRLLAPARRSLLGKTKLWPGYDVVHAHYLLPDGWLALQLGRLRRIPVVVTLRSTDVKLLRQAGRGSHTWRLARGVLAQVQGATVLNGPVQAFFQENFGCHPELIPHGIPGEMILAEVPGEKDVDVLTVASAIPRKQVDWVIRAFRDAPSATAGRMVVVGEGPSLPDWQQLAGGDERIVFTGRLPHTEVAQWMRRSKVFALPSYQETFGLVYLEAAAAGNALIGRAGEGVAGVFDEPEEMLFPHDYPTFKRALHQLLQDEVQRQSMAKAALGRVQQMSWSKIIDRYEALYRQVKFSAAE